MRKDLVVIDVKMHRACGMKSFRRYYPPRFQVNDCKHRTGGATSPDSHSVVSSKVRPFRYLFSQERSIHPHSWIALEVELRIFYYLWSGNPISGKTWGFVVGQIRGSHYPTFVECGRFVLLRVWQNEDRARQQHYRFISPFHVVEDS